MATSTFFGSTSRFELRGRLGEGGMGVVYEAYDREQRTVVALKTLGTHSADTLLSLKSEFRSVQDLHHPNLVQLGELIEEHGEWFFTMERIHGTDFVEYVRSSGARGGPGFDEARLRNALVQLARGLIALHAAGMVHRDVKPSNIMVTNEGRAVLLDFGIVRDLLAPSDAADEDDEIRGTAAYMAPEQVESAPLTAAADWYAVGIVLFQALTGEAPFRGSTLQILTQKMQDEAPPPSSRVAGAPADLEALCVDLMQRDPAARPDGAEILRRLGADADERAPSAKHALFVGRRAELDALDEAFAKVRTTGRAVTVSIEGESGVGKSRLAANFSALVLERYPGALRLFGRCYERESVPYKAVDGAIDSLAKFLGQHESTLEGLLPSGFGLLAKAFPVLAPFSRATPSFLEIASPQAQRQRVVAALRELLVRLASAAPLLIVIDDMQWADADSLELLREVLRPPHEPALLLVLTTRAGRSSDGDGPAPAVTAGEHRRLRLERLGTEDAEELIARLLGPGANDTELRARVRSIAEEAGGHPLFIDELVRHGGDSEAGPVGHRLDDVLWKRVGRLEAGARRILELTAVAGLPLAQSAAAAAAGLDEADLVRLVMALRAQHLVRTTGASRNDTIEPYHDRVRESVLAHLDADARRACHRHLALALELAGNADPEVLATHWNGATDPHRAATYAVIAGNRAATALAFDRASRLYRWALDLGPASAVEARTLKGRLADALTNGGRDAEAGAVRLDLAAGAPRFEALDLRRRAAEQFLSSGHFDRGIGLLKSVFASVHLSFPESRLGILLGLLFFRVVLTLRGLRFHERDAATLSPSTRLRIDVLRSAGQGLAMQQNVQGAYFQTRSLLQSLDAGDPERILRAISFEACFTSIGGTRTQSASLELVRSTSALAQKLGTPEGLALAHVAAGFRHFFLGEWSPSRDALLQAEHLFRDQCLGVAFELTSLRTVLYRALAYTGELRALAAKAIPVVRDAEQRGDRAASVTLRATALTLVGLASDEPDRARAQLREAAAGLVRERFLIQHYYCFTAETLLDLYCGDSASALARTLAVWPSLRRSLLLRMQNVRTYAVAYRGRAATAVALVRPKRREALLRAVDRDILCLEREGHPWAHADALLLRASVAWQRGDRGRSLNLYAEAAGAYDTMSMLLHGACARRRIGEATGGEGGERMVRDADEILRTEQVKDPRKFARSIAPELNVG